MLANRAGTKRATKRRVRLESQAVDHRTSHFHARKEDHAYDESTRVTERGSRDRAETSVTCGTLPQLRSFTTVQVAVSA